VRCTACWPPVTSTTRSLGYNQPMTKPRQGPLTPGEPVQLTDPKGRSHLITLRAGASFHTHRGTLSHDDIIGGPDGNVVRSQGGGTPYVVLRPLPAVFT